MHIDVNATTVVKKKKRKEKKNPPENQRAEPSETACSAHFQMCFPDYVMLWHC